VICSGTWMPREWCVEASAALTYCHVRRVFHCDLRPDNMLLNAELNLFCIDSLDVTSDTEIFGLGSSMYEYSGTFSWAFDP
jgi:serine/threonine protein kinase